MKHCPFCKVKCDDKGLCPNPKCWVDSNSPEYRRVKNGGKLRLIWMS